jgi:hypothetical protein
MSLQEEITNNPRALVANIDMCAMALIGNIDNLISQTILAVNADDPRIAAKALAQVQDSMQYLRDIRDSFAAGHGVTMTSQDSMAFIREQLVASLGEDKVAEAERTGKVPASVVADAMLDELFNS